MNINDIIKELKDGKCDDPKTLCDYKVMISASLYTATEMETDLEVAYIKRWEDIRNSEDMTDKRADMKSKLTDEWRDWQRARNTNKCLIEVNRSISRKLKNLEIIYNEGKF